jgi:hypothetical protein
MEAEIGVRLFIANARFSFEFGVSNDDVSCWLVSGGGTGSATRTMSPEGLCSRVLELLDRLVDDCWFLTTKGVTDRSSDAERRLCRLRRHDTIRMIAMSVDMSTHERMIATMFLVRTFADEPALLSPTIVELLEVEGDADGDESDAESKTGWETLAALIEDDVRVKLLETVLAPGVGWVLGAIGPGSGLVSVVIAVPMLLEALGSMTRKSDFEVAMGALR